MYLDPPLSAKVMGYDGPYVAGTTVDLTCSIDDGNPAALIFWTRNGISTSPANDDTLSLTFTQSDNAASLTCTAVNRLGSVESEDIEMVVHCESIHHAVISERPCF